MTARDEAIRAIRDAHDQWARDPHAGEFGRTMIDAIPADVLARLAIERGGLTEVRIPVPDGIGSIQLYAVVEP